MSGITLSDAVKALQPEISTAPEVAMASWTVIKNFPEMMSPFMKTSLFFAAGTTGLLGLSIIHSLVRARIPSTQKSPASDSPHQWRLLYAPSSAILTFTAFSRSLIALINAGAGCHILSKKIPQTITDLQPGMTAPSDTTLESWAILKHFVTTASVVPGLMQRSLMWTGIIASAAFVATAIVINHQKKVENEDQHQTKKRVLDNIALGSLGLAAVASLCGYLYIKTYAPIIS